MTALQTSLLQPLQRAITEGTWTGCEIAWGFARRQMLRRILSERVVEKSIITICYQVLNAAIHSKRIEDLRLGGSYRRIFQVGLFGLTTLNIYTSLRPQEKNRTKVSKLWDYTVRLYAIVNIALAVFEYRKKPVQTAVNFAMFGVDLILDKTLLMKKRSKVFWGIFGLDIFASAWVAYKGETLDKIAGVWGVLVYGWTFYKFLQTPSKNSPS